MSDYNVIDTDVERIMKESFIQYSMAVIVSRALPDVRDGLKPVHRRILYTMYENGLTPDQPYRKCADTVGSVLGKYHPHGDASVYDALVRLAQSFSLRYPLVDGHGNFGSVDGDPPAAYRYTEAKMAKMSMNMLTDINKNTVDFQSNYDDRLKEPVVLPSRFPNLLCNGSTGIAVGMATNIPPHNLHEIIEGMKCVMKNPDCSLDELMEHVKGPDFPTGGIIMGRAGIRAAYATGRGKITLRSQTSIEEINGRNCIIVTEIPYMVNKARLCVSIADLVKDKRIDGIHDLNDESGKDGMRIVIKLKKDANPQVVLNKLFSYTQLQDTVGVNMLALVNGIPKILTLKECLEQYIDFQVDVIRRRTQFDLKKAKEREHILQGLVIALDNIDEVVEILRSSKTIAEGKQRLMDRFDLTEIQADHIVNMTLGKLTGMERQKLLDELAELKIKIADLEDILANHQRVLDIIIEEVEAIQEKFGDERRTRIENVSGEVDIEDLIPEEESFVTYTKGGYIKRTPISEYHAQKRGGKGVTGMKQREDDYVEEMYTCSTHDFMLFISNKGIMYKLKCYELPEGSKASRGTNIVNILPLENDEKIAAMIKTDSFEDGKFIVMVTKNGKIKRTPLSSYKNGDVCGIKVVDDEDDIIMISTDGVVIRIRACDISVMGRYSKGVRLMRVSEDGKVVAFTRTEHEEDAEITEVEQASAEDIAQAAEEEANEVVTEDVAPDDEDAADDGNDEEDEISEDDGDEE